MTDHDIETIAGAAWWLLCPAIILAIDHAAGGLAMRSPAGLAEVIALMVGCTQYRRIGRLTAHVVRRLGRAVGRG